MRRILIAGNWKMNMDLASGLELAQGIASQSSELDGVDLLVCPPFVYLNGVAQAIGGSSVAVGAQDVYHKASGAFTGEVSTGMLKDIGCSHVILGHSERRHILGETDAMVNEKAKAALAAGLTPIVCVGELLEEREAGKTAEVVTTQLLAAFADISAEDAAKVVLAYEPVWAIGTGKVATPAQAEEVHAELRGQLATRYNAELSEKIRILYGGSVKGENAPELLAQPNVDGALVGGASLKVDGFVAIARAGAAL